MIDSTLVQTEKTINVIFKNKEYTVTITTTENSFDSEFTIMNEKGEIIDEESIIGLEISDHIINKYI
jgi:hypothetical protein